MIGFSCKIFFGQLLSGERATGSALFNKTGDKCFFAQNPQSVEITISGKVVAYILGLRLEDTTL